MGTLKVHPPCSRPDLPAPHPRQEADRQRPLLPCPPGLPEAHRLLQQVAVRRRPPRSCQAQEHDKEVRRRRRRRRINTECLCCVKCSHQKNSSSPSRNIYVKKPKKRPAYPTESIWPSREHKERVQKLYFSHF